MDTITISRVPLDALHPDPANARQHGERNVDAICGSLARFGQVEPLVVHKPTGRVIGGNGRLTAMKALGWSHADVVELDISVNVPGTTHRPSPAFPCPIPHVGAAPYPAIWPRTLARTWLRRSSTSAA